MPVPVIGLALAFQALVPTASTSATLVATPAAVVMPLHQSVEEYVREQFKDAPIMIDIARCESRFRQYDSKGAVLKNPTSSAMGVFQVMASIHANAAKTNLGLDIYSLEGNVDYARYLYERQGTTPWNDSKGCWGKSGHLAGTQAKTN